MTAERPDPPHPTGVSVKLFKGTQEVTLQTPKRTVQGTLQTPATDTPLLSVDERRASLIGWFAARVASAAEQSEADGKDAVPDRSGVGPGTGEQEEEDLQVRQQEEQRPHPAGEVRQASDEAPEPADGRGRSRGADSAFLHMLQTQAVHLKGVIHPHDAEQQVESHAHPSHPLTEVHHPPYCGQTHEHVRGQKHVT